MTKEGEEIEILKAYRDKLSNSASNQLDKDIKAFDAAIKALEEQPFMNKPCVAHQVCHEDKVKVLDNIRYEIKLLQYHPKLDFIKNDEVIETVLNIIDKYKAEKEARARWICCPMCDKKKCEREADDCDVKIYLKSEGEKEE